MRSAAHLLMWVALCLTLTDTTSVIQQANAIEASRRVAPRRVQWLIYYHECGHILRGPNEGAADCYAVRRARREGWLNRKTLEDICTTFNIAGHGPVHADPDQRCIQLRQCFNKKAAR